MCLTYFLWCIHTWVPHKIRLITNTHIKSFFFHVITKSSNCSRCSKNKKKLFSIFADGKPPPFNNEAYSAFKRGNVVKGILCPSLTNSFKARSLERSYLTYSHRQRQKSLIIVNIVDLVLKAILSVVWAWRRSDRVSKYLILNNFWYHRTYPIIASLYILLNHFTESTSTSLSNIRFCDDEYAYVLSST